MSNEPKDHTVRVLARHDYNPDAFRLDLEAPELADAVQPGQFIMAGIPGGGHDPLLRRPLGYLGRDREAGRLSVLVRKVGRGTRMLGDLQPGHELNMLGPLGRGWTPPDRGPVLLAAGGIGIAPLYDLAVRYAADLPMVMVYGMRTDGELYLQRELSALPLELIPATDDGSRGIHGTVADALRRLDPKRFTRFYGCGPRPMLTFLQSYFGAAGVAGELSLEERMACGFGACLGCAVATRDPGGRLVYKRTCADGPVFSAAEVDFHV